MSKNHVKKSASMQAPSSNKSVSSAASEFADAPKYKIVFLGDSSTGKTSIITRYMQDNFETAYQATIGIDFLSKTMTLDNGQVARLQLWDTAGQERFQSLIPSYLRNASAAVIVYDISNHESFDNTNRWIEKVLENQSEESPIVLCLLGNKTDLGSDRRQVTAEEAEERAQQRDNMLFMECSAKAGYNIKSFFNKLANALPPPPPPPPPTPPSMTEKMTLWARAASLDSAPPPAPQQQRQEQPTIVLHNSSPYGTASLAQASKESCGC